MSAAFVCALLVLGGHWLIMWMDFGVIVVCSIILYSNRIGLDKSGRTGCGKQWIDLSFIRFEGTRERA
jgi:hypothetical protein